MKRSRFGDEQIIGMIKEQEAGTPTPAAGVFRSRYRPFERTLHQRATRRCSFARGYEGDGCRTAAVWVSPHPRDAGASGDVDEPEEAATPFTREEKLQVRKRGGRKRAPGTRRPMGVPDRPDERWSLDVVSDAYTDGRRFRVLAAVDDFSRDCLALVADTSISGLRMTREVDAIIEQRGRPHTIVSDNVLCRENLAA